MTMFWELGDFEYEETSSVRKDETPTIMAMRCRSGVLCRQDQNFDSTKNGDFSFFLFFSEESNAMTIFFELEPKSWCV